METTYNNIEQFGVQVTVYQGEDIVWICVSCGGVECHRAARNVEEFKRSFRDDLPIILKDALYV